MGRYRGSGQRGAQPRCWAFYADNFGLWIAASATANGLPLVTLNRRHFEPLTLHGLQLL
jgi:predicted nucleic acid-binding protein